MNRTLSLDPVNSLLTFLFIWKWLILNKSYSSCSREFTQGKCNTSTISKMKCQFIPHVHKIILYCISRVLSVQLKLINHSRHKPLHSQNTQDLQCFYAIRDFYQWSFSPISEYSLLPNPPRRFHSFFFFLWVFSVQMSTLRHSAPHPLPLPHNLENSLYCVLCCKCLIICLSPCR